MLSTDGGRSHENDAGDDSSKGSLACNVQLSVRKRDTIITLLRKMCRCIGVSK